MEVYNIRTKDWSRGASLPEPRHAASVVSVSCVLYIIGNSLDRQYILSNAMDMS